MIYITNEEETLLLGIISNTNLKKIVKNLEKVYEEKLYEAESDQYDEYVDLFTDLENVLILEKEYFKEDLLDFEPKMKLFIL
ncbi:MAG: hypothetical protein NZZ41_01625 [Candidatus Dojkabacteria bacterium]|nr:hypothetical protein [Candidatus Dojkabacteria bacterium]